MAGEDRTGLLILRVNLAPSASKSLRINIRLTTDVSGGFEVSTDLSDTNAVIELVRQWLDQMARFSEIDSY
jgi:hypothetical protein